MSRIEKAAQTGGAMMCEHAGVPGSLGQIHPASGLDPQRRAPPDLASFSKARPDVGRQIQSPAPPPAFAPNFMKLPSPAGAINWNFVTGHESDKAAFYVPMNKNGEVLGDSGVTVGKGMDLGKWDEDKLRKYGVSKETIAKLAPYLGDTQDYAKDDLKAAEANKETLTLNSTELAEVNRAAQLSTENEARHLLNNALRRQGTDAPGAWESLPAEAKTVVADVTHQYGKDSKHFMDSIARGDWTEARAILLSFTSKEETVSLKNAGTPDADYKGTWVQSGEGADATVTRMQYYNRRKDDADLLQKLINSQKPMYLDDPPSGDPEDPSAVG